MNREETLATIRTLRAMGATSVKVDGIEVVFGGQSESHPSPEVPRQLEEEEPSISPELMTGDALRDAAMQARFGGVL